MKSYEKESFITSFILLFSVQLLFLSLLMWQYYMQNLQKYEIQISHEMTQCSFTLDCSEYETEFVDKIEAKELNFLYKEKHYYMLFQIPTMDEYWMKLTLKNEYYILKKEHIFYEIVKQYLLYVLILLLISLLFARFSIRPLKEALELNDEFVKDILHDFNTPLSSLKINFKILEKKYGEDSAITRSDEAMQSIASLQANLTYFLSHSRLEKEEILLNELIESKLSLVQALFPTIHFSMDIPHIKILVNEDAFIRIIMNLLTNAGKYNSKNGSVQISYAQGVLTIQDSGIGIQNTDKVFDRFYRETNRGIGIGLHVVKKLSDDLKIGIKLESQLGKGTVFNLDLRNIILI